MCIPGFRSALCTYLRSYQKKKLLELAESYADYDFSLIDNCYFIGITYFIYAVVSIFRKIEMNNHICDTYILYTMH